MALDGHLVNGRCFSTLDAATDSFYSVAGMKVYAATTSYEHYFYKSAGVWRHKSNTLTSTGTRNQRYDIVAPVPAFPACDPAASFFDGISIGWGIAAAMIAASSFALMRRAAR